MTGCGEEARLDPELHLPAWSSAKRDMADEDEVVGGEGLLGAVNAEIG